MTITAKFILFGIIIFGFSYYFFRRFLKERKKRNDSVVNDDAIFIDLESNVKHIRRKIIPALKKEVDALKLELDMVKRDVHDNRFSVRDVSSKLNHMEKYR